MTRARTPFDLTSLFVAGLALATAGHAFEHAQAQSQGGQHPPHKPPPEAFDACADKSEGTDCTVDFHGKSLDGVCLKEEQETPFCLPNDMPEPPAGGHGPGGPGGAPPPR